MSAKTNRLLTMCGALSLALILTVPGAAYGVEDTPELPAEQSSASATGSGLGDAVVAAVEAGATSEVDIAAEVSVAPTAAGGGFTYDDAGRMLVMVIADPAVGDAATLVGSIAAVHSSLAPLPGVMAWVDPTRLEELATITGVTSVTPSLAPVTSNAYQANSMHAAPQPAAPSNTVAEACNPVPIEADTPLGSAEAREKFGVDGTGVTIGVISDSFDKITMPTSWADDVASGALPGPGNPCGYETAVTILSDALPSGEDEGRAMAQLVHGIAPGATLIFADSGVGELGMAENIRKLAEAGADIIVDDITYLSESYYQRGFISQAIETVKAEYDVLYFTSAGNSNGVGNMAAANGVPVGSWQTTRYREMACPAWVTQGADGQALPAGSDCLDFDPDPAVEQAYDVLRIKGQVGAGTVDVAPIASIGEPVAGVTTSYELQLYESCATTPTLLAAIPSMGGLLPSGAWLYPGLSGSATLNLGTDVCLVMVRTAFEAGTHPAVFLGFVRGGDAIATRHFMGNRDLGTAATDWVGESVFGHGGDGSAIGVGSTEWDDPTEMRGYSSLGPTTLLYEGVDLQSLNPAPRLTAPQLVSSPQVAAVDGVQTSFFGGNEGTPEQPEYRFYGTSAAAPLAAAVAGLGKAYAPAITGATLGDAVKATARSTAEGGPSNPYAAAGFSDEHVFGAGLVSATRLIESLPQAPDAPAELRISVKKDTELGFSWGAVPRAEGLVAELYDGATEGGTLITSLELAGQATEQNFTGLVPNHQYTLRLTAVGEQAAKTSAELAAYTLASAPANLTATKSTEQSITVSWTETSVPAHYLVSVAPTTGEAITNTDDVVGGGSVADTESISGGTGAGLIVPVEIAAGSTEFTFDGLEPGMKYQVTVNAVNVEGDASRTSVIAQTSSASGSGTAGDTNHANKDATPGLAQTGGQGYMPLLIGGGALLVLGAVAVTVVQWRKRRAATSDSRENDGSNSP